MDRVSLLFSKLGIERVTEVWHPTVIVDFMCFWCLAFFLIPPWCDVTLAGRFRSGD